MANFTRRIVVSLWRGLPLRLRTLLKSVDRRYLRPTRRFATSPFRGEPTFFIIGAMKGGTTSLYRYLSEAPDVAMAMVKEVEYFTLHHDRSRAWYRSRFPLRVNNSSSVRGETTPYYLFHPYAPARLAAAYPDAKLIVLLREPVARAVSHYVAMAASGREPLTLAGAVRREMEEPGTPDEIVRAGGPELERSLHRVNSYVGRGFYAEQLDRWLEYFPRSAMFIGRSEDLFDRPQLFMDEVSQFLGVSPLPGSVVYEVHNPGLRLPLSRADEDLASAVEALETIYKASNADLLDRYGIGWDETIGGEPLGE